MDGRSLPICDETVTDSPVVLNPTRGRNELTITVAVALASSTLNVRLRRDARSA